MILLCNLTRIVCFLILFLVLLFPLKLSFLWLHTTLVCQGHKACGQLGLHGADSSSSSVPCCHPWWIHECQILLLKPSERWRKQCLILLEALTLRKNFAGTLHPVQTVNPASSWFSSAGSSLGCGRTFSRRVESQRPSADSLAFHSEHLSRQEPHKLTGENGAVMI